MLLGEIIMLEEPRPNESEAIINLLVNKTNSKTQYIKDYTRAIQFVFTDGDPYWVKITEGRVEKVEKVNRKQDAAVTVTCTSETLRKILEGMMNSIQALLTRKVKIDGPISIIRELRQKVLGYFKPQ